MYDVTVAEGQADKDITNIAVVEGDNVDDPDQPEEEVKIYPREPVLESEKSAQNLEEGKDTFEVGDTIAYTIQTYNTVKDSIVENLVISDVLPEGLTYVDGSLEVSHEGTGAYNNGTITAHFGDVTDTEWRTVAFQATIESGYTGESLTHVSTVEGDNIDEPDHPEEDITVTKGAPSKPEESDDQSSNIDEDTDKVINEKKLPKTATNNFNLILAGLLLLLIGTTVSYWRKKKLR